MKNAENDDYTREQLIEICEAAVVQKDKWRNRDSPSAHEKLGLCWVMLKAGCEFSIHPRRPDKPGGCFTTARTIWLRIQWPNFSSFEYADGATDDDTFYLPTPERLAEREGRDWY